jgi:hypothetical protein
MEGDMNPIETNAYSLLRLIVEADKEQYDNIMLQQMSGLSPRDLSDAVQFLRDIDAVEVIKTLGTAPFAFHSIFVKSRGRYLYHEAESQKEKGDVTMTALPVRPLNPIGSPYGFTEQDWETVAFHKEEDKTLYVVMGMQFKSVFYDSDLLARNIESLFQKAVDEINKSLGSSVTLRFERLAAGLGEHLFNQIVRSIIGSDVAVFETSDLNPNVMIEMGVALTWGVRVLPIKVIERPSPPSDISGQTWVEYGDSANVIKDDKFGHKLRIMLKRVISGKGKLQ